jgi:CheY-like chemotaxis protein
VLIVENDAVFRIPLRVALAVESYAVVAVVSAEAAETVLDHEAIDVVLTDLDLPDMDGAVLAARPPAVPFPLITGSPPDLAADGATAAVGEVVTVRRPPISWSCFAGPRRQQRQPGT